MSSSKPSKRRSRKTPELVDEVPEVDTVPAPEEPTKNQKTPVNSDFDDLVRTQAELLGKLKDYLKQLEGNERKLEKMFTVQNKELEKLRSGETKKRTSTSAASKKSRKSATSS